MLFWSFGDNLGRLKQDRQISQEGLALVCGLDRAYISGLERGRKPTLKNLLLIAINLDVSVSYLL